MSDAIQVPKLYKVNTYFYKSDLGEVVERYVEDDDGNQYFLDRELKPLIKKH